MPTSVSMAGRRQWPLGIWNAPLSTLQQGAANALEAPEAVELLKLMLAAHNNEAHRPSLRLPILHSCSRVLRSAMASPQGKAAAASIVGALSAQNCQSCRLEQAESPEVILPEPAIILSVFECMCSAPPASFLLTETASALTTILSCTTCQGPCSRKLQQHLCIHGVVPAVLHGLRTSLAATTPLAVCPSWLPPAMHTLRLLVTGMPPAALAAVVADGWPLIKTVLVRSAKDPGVLSDAAVILASLFPVWTMSGVHPGRSEALPAFHADSLVLVANIAAASAAHGHVSTARDAAWALACMAVHAARHPALADGALPVVQQQQLWVMLTGQVMLIVMDMLTNVAQQDHGLAKHCLQYIEVVAGACQRGGHSTAVAACGDGSATQFLRDALQLAASVAKLANELRLQVCALRCMRALLGHPHVFGLLSDDDTVATLLRTTSLVRFTPGCNPKQVALLQAYGMCVLSSLLTRDNLQTLQASTAASVAPEAHASLAFVVSLVVEQAQAGAKGTMLPWQVEEAAHEPEGTGCRLGSTCVTSHEELSTDLVASMAAACAHVLEWSSAAGLALPGVDCPNAMTMLHCLSAAGLDEAARAFAAAAGPVLDLGSSGMTNTGVHAGIGPLSDLQHSALPLVMGLPLPSTAQPNHRLSRPALLATGTLTSNPVLGPDWLAAPSPPGHTQGPPARASLPKTQSAAARMPMLTGQQLPLSPVSASETTQSLSQSLEETLSQGAMGGDGGFRVDTVALSQLIGSVVKGGNSTSLTSLPAWLSAGVAAAVSAHEEAVALLAATASVGAHEESVATQRLRAEDLALIADAEALLSSQRLAGPDGSIGRMDALDDGSVEGEGSGRGVSKHLWLGNLSTKLPRSVLKAVFEHFGVVEDVVTFPGRMYAFVNFRNPDDAVRAANSLNDREVPPLTGSRRLVVKFRPSKKALGKSADGPGADAAAAAAASTGTGQITPAVGGSEEADDGGDEAGTGSGNGDNGCASQLTRDAPSKTDSRSSLCSSNTGAISGEGSGALAGPTRQLIKAGSSSGNGGPPKQPRQNPGGAGTSAHGRSVLDNHLHTTSTGSEDDLAGNAGSSSDSGCDTSAAQPSCDSGTGGSAGRQQMSSLAGRTSSAGDGEATNPGSSSPDSFTDVDEAIFAEGRPSRHLWLGNIPLRPNKQAMETLFSQYGAVESVRVFPGKTFAFVNYVDAADAMQAKAGLDGQMATSVTGLKPLAIRFQKDTPSSSPSPELSTHPSPAPALACEGPCRDLPAGSTSAARMDPQPSTAPLSGAQQLLNAAVAAVARTNSIKPASPLAGQLSGSLARDGSTSSNAGYAPISLASGLTNRVASIPGLANAASLSKLLDEDVPQEPAINLSNRLNPNNVHFDKELAARYKRMTKAEKEALWAQDRMLQQMASSTAAAALLTAAQGVDGGTAALLAGAGLGLTANHQPVAAGLTLHPAELAELHRLNQLLPRSLPASQLAAAAAVQAAQLQAVVGHGRMGLVGGVPLAAATAAVPSAPPAALLGGPAGAAALLQAQLGLLGGDNGSQAATMAVMQAQLLQQQQQQNQLAALGLGSMVTPQPAAVSAAQQLQQQLESLALSGKSLLPAADLLPPLNPNMKQLLQQQQQQQQVALLNSLQAQASMGRGQPDLNTMMQAQLLANLNAGQPAQVTGGDLGCLGQSHLSHGTGTLHPAVAAPMATLGGAPRYAGAMGAPVAPIAPRPAMVVPQPDYQQLQLQQLLMQAQHQEVQQPQPTVVRPSPNSFMCPLTGVIMTDPDNAQCRRS